MRRSYVTVFQTYLPRGASEAPFGERDIEPTYDSADNFNGEEVCAKQELQERHEHPTLIPNMVRFHGVLAPNSALREEVVASATAYVSPSENTAPNPVQLPVFGRHFDEPEADVGHERRKPWAWLLRHAFALMSRYVRNAPGR